MLFILKAQQIPHCVVALGDRPIHITIQRALRSLSWWQTIKLSWYFLTTSDNVTKEEIERCKRRDFLGDVMAELAMTYPALEEVFVKERDIFLTRALQIACEPVRTQHGSIPARVVGVVGIGHTLGIAELWGKVDESQIPPIMRCAVKTHFYKFQELLITLRSILYSFQCTSPLVEQQSAEMVGQSVARKRHSIYVLQSHPHSILQHRSIIQVIGIRTFESYQLITNNAKNVAFTGISF